LYRYNKNELLCSHCTRVLISLLFIISYVLLFLNWKIRTWPSGLFWRVSLTRVAPEHISHDVSAMSGPIPGTVCLISMMCLVLCIFMIIVWLICYCYSYFLCLYCFFTISWLKAKDTAIVEGARGEAATFAAAQLRRWQSGARGEPVTFRRPYSGRTTVWPLGFGAEMLNPLPRGL